MEKTSNELTVKVLYALYSDSYDELNYENVDDFYAYLGYQLELFNVLQELDFSGTSDLLEALISCEKNQ